MDCPRDQLLAGSAFAAQHDGAVGRRAARDQAEHGLHGGALADDVLEPVAGAVLVVGSGRPAQGATPVEDPPDRQLQVFGLKRLGQVILGAELHRLHGGADLVQTGDHDHVDVRPRLLDPAQHLDAVHLRHLDVQHQQVVIVLVDQGQRRQAVPRRVDLVLTAEDPLTTAENDFLVVNEQDSAFHSFAPDSPCSSSCPLSSGR